MTDVLYPTFKALQTVYYKDTLTEYTTLDKNNIFQRFKIKVCVLWSHTEFAIIFKNHRFQAVIFWLTSCSTVMHRQWNA